MRFLAIGELVCVAGLAASGAACAGADNLLAGAFQKAAEPEKETMEQQHWRFVKEARAVAEQRPQVTDENSLTAASRAVVGYGDSVGVYLEEHCVGEPRGSHCDEAAKYGDEAMQWQHGVYEQAMGVGSIDFDLLQDKLMLFERRNAERGVTIDTWMEELGKRKLDYWSGELGARGGTLAKYAAAKGEAICLAYGSDPTKSDTKNIDFMVQNGDTIWIKCAFTQPPAGFKRDAGDYWRISHMWSGEWEDINLNYDVAKPSSSEIVVFSFPADVVREKIATMASVSGFKYPGKWLRVRAQYNTRYITGQAWQDEKWVDTWKHEPMVEVSVYFKWK